MAATEENMSKGRQLDPLGELVQVKCAVELGREHAVQSLGRKGMQHAVVEHTGEVDDGTQRRVPSGLPPTEAAPGRARRCRTPRCSP